ncbi:MAG: ATP-binding protein [Gemmataceae bacterium]
MKRPPRILHCTSEPLVFFGRQEELDLLNRALHPGGPSIIALVGPGGQGKTAIVHHWIHHRHDDIDGLFFWSFYRAKDCDLCLREWLAYAEGLAEPPPVSASYCVERLLTILRQERWAIVLDGTEVVQYDEGPWLGRFLHPELGRLLEELGSQAIPGVVALTSRFGLPTLERRHFVRRVQLDRLDPASARQLLASLGVHGAPDDLDRVANVGGRHAKAVELLGTYLVRYQAGQSHQLSLAEGDSDVEASVARVLSLYHQALPAEQQDMLALATAFREPPTESLLIDYLQSHAVETLLHGTWERTYPPYSQRPVSWIPEQLEELVGLRLLERVGPGIIPVVDAHPLVRRGFEHVAGPAGRRESALARAGFLRGRPDRRRPDSLEEARPAIELFHAHAEAGLWAEADSALRALENPKHRLLAPALERELLLRFFPESDWRRPPIWPGFGRWRSLAICFEMLGAFEEALAIYRPEDAPLRGDALLALGRLDPLLNTHRVAAPWDNLWQAYRCHALSLAGQLDQAVALAGVVMPQDIYEWVHVFEGLLRAGRLDVMDPRSLSSIGNGEQRWANLVRERMLLDHARIFQGAQTHQGSRYQVLTSEFDQAGLPVERLLTRLSHIALCYSLGDWTSAQTIIDQAIRLVETSHLPGLEPDVWAWQAELCRGCGDSAGEARARVRYQELRLSGPLQGPSRP